MATGLASTNFPREIRSTEDAVQATRLLDEMKARWSRLGQAERKYFQQLERRLRLFYLDRIDSTLDTAVEHV